MNWTPRQVGHRATERCCDWWLGIRTRDYLPAQALSDDPDAAAYEAAPFPRLWRLLKHIPGDFRGRGFLDFGCGLGRVVFLAHRRGYFPVVGVEISAGLCARARINLARTHADVVQGNALDYRIASAVRIFFLFNPFRGTTLRSVINNIEAHADSVGDCLIAAMTLRHLEPLLQERPNIHRCFYYSSGDAYDLAIYQVGSPALSQVHGAVPAPGRAVG
ncbi:MAG: class I SAM-dependent methyltransferase [Terriglobales bacterium]